MTTRRKFLSSLSLAGAALAVSPNLVYGATSANKLRNIGYIGGILGNNFTEDKGNWKELLNETVEYGFSEFEGGYLGDSPKVFMDYCKSIGLKPIAGGIGITDDMNKIKESFDKANALNTKYIVTYWPWFVGPPFSLDDCKRSTEWLNKTGELAKDNGLKLCWHNHDKEFHEMEEGLPFDYLMEHTDEDLVFCEMDIYWVAKGGADPVKVLKKYEGRFPLMHVKDMAEGAEQSITCPGSGIIDFPSIFAEAKRQGLKHYFVERDKAVDGLACLKSSGEYLQNLRF